MTLEELNRLDPEVAEQGFLKCCGSLHWSKAMVAARPFESWKAVEATADAVWEKCSTENWLEAFAAHPRIGDRTDGKWTQQEQSGMSTAAEVLRASIAEGNRLYEEKFGFVFLICATGRSAQEMEVALKERLQHSREEEIGIASAEQAKITKIRLKKWSEEKE